MKAMSLVKRLKLFDTYGRIAIASLLICGLTGFFLIIPYDPLKAYLSVTAFVTSNPAASLTRNIHYWSAQLFLIFTILHFIDHLKSVIPIKTGKTKKGKITYGIWFRLVLSVLIVFYVMLSGFILKDDTDSRQAHMLFSGLLSSFPLVGEYLSTFFSGKSGSLITIYLHHAATATIIIFIVVFEHVRDLKVKWPTFAYTTLFIVILSIFLRAPLSQPNESIMKGPWYFVGVQELLHQFTDPLIVISFMLLFLAVIYLVPLVEEKTSGFLRKVVWAFLAVYIILTLIGYFFRGSFYEWQMPFHSNYQTPATISVKPLNVLVNNHSELVEVNGRIEGCMSCHKGMQGLSTSHDPNTIGCFSCHGGDPYTLDANAAHKGMFKVPGNISNSKETCGSSGCHEEIVERVPKSMMATLSGLIAVDKWTFGENTTPNGNFNVDRIGNSPADIHLRNLCAGCHLGMEKTNHGNPGWLERGGGCNACHLTYTPEDMKSLGEIRDMKTSGLRKLTHPKIDLNITNDKCESCHSRSGRISMAYAGWHETDLKVLPPVKEDYRKLPDGRIFKKQPADIHHDAGMLCIDCHGSYELMGDGKTYMHKEEAVRITCEDCHTDNSNFIIKKLSETDRESQLIAWVRGWNQNNPEVLLTQKENRPVVNAWFDHKERKAVMISKSTGKIHPLKSPLPQCISDNAHKRLSCETCHTSWVPQCIGCHNAYEKETAGYDMLKRKPRKGTWVEYSGEALAEPPVLGMKNTNLSYESQQVGIFAPGMIMTIEQKDNSKKQHRLYAPVSGHTTQRASRSCVSCHLDPLAIGFGRGTIELLNNGTWSFTPLYASNNHDKLPEDSWTGFLRERKDQAATRLNMRPFNVSEQKRILRAGACLKCHEEQSTVIRNCLNDFEKTMQQASSRCIIPE